MDGIEANRDRARLGPTSPRGVLLLTLVVGVLVAVAGFVPAVARADAGDAGYEDQSWSGTGTPTGTKRSESVVWFNDGSWWGDMWDTASQDFHIFRLDTGTQRWIDTGTPIDTRFYTHADVRWDGTHLYVASHKYVSDGKPAVSGYPAYLYRFSYDPLTRRYSRDSGFPETISQEKSETLVIDKDSTGTLWATWQQDNQIYVNRTTSGDRGWGTPFRLPAGATDVTVDDNSAVIAFGGNRVGVMWSNQGSTDDGMYFAVHDDGQPAGSWSASETVIQGHDSADDHMSLRAVGATVYAAVKTSYTTSSAVLSMLLVRAPSSGSWTSYPVARVSDCPTRPTVIIDTENRVLHSFATYPAPPSYTCSTLGGAIYEKTSPLDAISFPSGRGTPVLVDADSPYLNDVSSSKQNVDSSTGIAVLASNDHTLRYWHAFEPISPASGTVAPAAGFTATPTSGSAPLSVAFRDTSSGAPTRWSWDFGDGATSTAQNPTHVYQAAGSYTATLTVANTAGTTTATRLITAFRTLAFAPVADADVNDTRPANNYAATTTLRVRRATDPTVTSYHSYLKFTVSGITTAVRSAKLRLYVADPSADGGSLYTVSNAWTEPTITWNNAPAIAGSAISSVGKTALGTQVELDLGSTIAADGTYSFALASASTDLAMYSSREGANPPQLVLAVAP